MPTRPNLRTLTNSSVDVLNAIRNSATVNYREHVPIATPNADVIRSIGAVMMDNVQLQNEFLNALVNRIGLVLMTSKMYSNPWSMFKKGMLEYGETIEEIFVEIAKPHQYDIDESETKLFARETPDVKSAFHVLNYQKFYKQTIQQEQLRQAFLSINGVTELITKIIDAMYAGAAYDEFLTMKYMLALHILRGQLKGVTIPEVSAANAKGIVSKIKGVSGSMEFMNRDYNLAGVQTYASKDEQYLITSVDFDSIMDVEVLASAFNMNKAEFDGHRVTVDGFGHLDLERLAKLFEDDDTYVELTSAQLAALDAVPAVLVSRDYFMIFDNMQKMTEQYNGQGLYWNYMYHTWKTFSVSPFANAVMFIPATPTVSTITISPSSATVAAGQTIALSATVGTTNFAPQTIKWTSDTEGVTVSDTGLVTIPADAEDATEVTITATSVFDPSKSGTATITVAVE